MPKKLTNNIYNLDPKLDRKHKSTVLQMQFDYFVPEDAVDVTIEIRKDAAESPELLIRLARAVEKSLRKIIPAYDEDIMLLEAAARAYLGEEESDGSGHQEDDGERLKRCRCS